MTTKFHGVIPPVVTPLTTDRKLDVPSYERLINRLIEQGVNGLFVLGSSSEVAYLDDESRGRVLAEAKRINDGRVPLLAGVIDTETQRVISHIRQAEEIGVDAVVATAPFYAVTGLTEVENHFRALHEATSLPVFVYDIPICVHIKVPVDLMMKLGREGIIAGCKDSSGDDVSFRRLAMANRAAGSPLSLFTGHEVVVDGAYMSGADGVVPGLGNVDATNYVAMYKAYRKGDWETVRTEQDKAAALMEIVNAPQGVVGPAAGVGAFKTALQLLGVIETNTMSVPMPTLTGENVERVAEVLRRVGLLA
ncbi:dihydrodipicolinate synthase family protein [Cutibacterium sp.]|uniref:dihydrodipicolinate synthase family protein n=1 Tax=Cutibacterium sp. TaxID=1912221 RepID=UPI0026DBB3A3|nr:dihydrodipicolinate synthase family protein [Cutibacterium sp.]MDO4412231.1 dihydrodipicolinate synthase family protein [Cutibacterium sp.]